MAHRVILLGLSALFFLGFSNCATDPGTSTPIAGSSITKFTYERGEISVVVNVTENTIRRGTQITAAAVLFDFNPTTGERTEAGSLDTDVSVIWPDFVTFSIPNCTGTATLLSTKVLTTSKIFYYSYPTSCTASAENRITSEATLSVNKTGFATKTLNGAGASPGGATLQYHTLFVTSTVSTGNLGGLPGADAICNARAAVGTATKTLGGTWKAILSTSTVNAKDRLGLTGSFAIKNTAGSTLSNAASTLWTPPLLTAVDYDENGTFKTIGNVWSSTDSAGFFDSSYNENCLNWTTSESAEYATRGSPRSTTNWIQTLGNDSCDLTTSIYCINAN